MSGRYIDVTTPAGPTPAYLVKPDGGAGPGVLMYMDAIGLRPRIEEMADRIAGWGYVVLAPHLFHRQVPVEEFVPRVDLRVAGEREHHFATVVMPVMAAFTPDQARQDAAAYVDALQGLDGVRPGSIATIGYCMGGVMALRTAALRPDVVDAVATFHAGNVVNDTPDSVHLTFERLDAEILMAHADNDGSMPPDAIATAEESLRSSGVPFTSEVYEGSPHGFTMADTSSYDEDGAERHFRELEALLSRALPR